jgi:hypothetical protein
MKGKNASTCRDLEFRRNIYAKGRDLTHKYIGIKYVDKISVEWSLSF